MPSTITICGHVQAMCCRCNALCAIARGWRASVNDEESQELADEHAALHRVATLVASGVAPEKVFAAVTEEVGQLLSVEFANLGRYEPDGTISFVATWGKMGASFRADHRLMLGGKNPCHARLRDRPSDANRRLRRCLRTAG
jgi:hypothetical protein